MAEINKSQYQIEQNNQVYILSTSIIYNKLKLVCQESNKQIFEAYFSINDLIQLNKLFQPNHTVEQIQLYLNSIIENQKIAIAQNNSQLNIILYLNNKEQIIIPLPKKIVNNAINYNNYQYNTSHNILTTNQYLHQKNDILINPSNQYYNINSNIIQDPSNIHQQQHLYQNKANEQYSTINQGIENIKMLSGRIQIPQNNVNSINQINQNQLASIPNNGVQIAKADTTPANYSYGFDQNAIGKLEDDTNIIRAEQEKLKNDMKRLIEEASRYKEENKIFKIDIEKLKNENEVFKKENETLKNESENYRNQIIAFQNSQNENKGLEDENNSLRKEVALLNKDVQALDNQNDQIRKMYENLENENNVYKNQIQELNKENELLRGQIQELNENFTLINNELENIKNENSIVKSNTEQQNQNKNEELINKLVEENKIYKQKAEENVLLKKQIEELQYQLQMGQERQQEEEDQDQGKEVKGDIIHDIKELEMITKKINKDENKKIIINLLYKASVDSDKASAFHEKCDQAQNTIVLVETKNGKRFGGYTTCSWSGNCVDKNDPEAFIFSFDKMKTYDNIPGDEAIGCYPKFGPIFLGCQIKIFDNAFTKGGTTFEKELNFYTEEDYELTGGERVFDVKDIEVYEVIIE